MSKFLDTLTYINKAVYEPRQLAIDSIQEEKQNQEYGGGVFRLESKAIRFRVAKITPTKTGQFVAVWEKDETFRNRPFLADDAPELLIVTTFKNKYDFGQFVFPKDILIQQNILRSDSTRGKMALRVYPSWDKPTSKQAIKTQKWQLPFFADLSKLDQPSIDKLIKLHHLNEENN